MGGVRLVVLIGARNDRWGRTVTPTRRKPPFGGKPALKNREAGSSKACAGTNVLAANKRIGEAKRLQSAP